MQVNFDNPGGLVPLSSFSAERRLKPVLEPDRADLHELEELHHLLRESGEIRPEVVERARALVETTDYPPLEIARRIATLLALRLKDAPDTHTESSS